MSETTEKKPKRRPPCMLTVEKKTYVNERLLRLDFSSDGLHDFPANAGARHIKLFFPKPHQKVPVLPTLGPNGPVWPPAKDKPIPRTYSVRGFDEATKQLSVEFVDHGENSVGSSWARKSSIGDKVGLAGPGGPDPIIAPAKFHILAGDLSAVPALSAVLEGLPKDACGSAFIHIAKADDKIDLVKPSNFKIHWSYGAEDLITQVKTTDFSEYKGDCSAFIAGESYEVLTIRDFLRESLGLTKANMYAIPYWKRRQDEETFHEDRHRIMDEEY